MTCISLQLYSHYSIKDSHVVITFSNAVFSNIRLSENQFFIWCEHRIRKNQQIKSTAHDGKSDLK